MTREELSKILETFAVLVLETGLADIDTKTQYGLISTGIDSIVDAVMFCSDKSRVANPSIN